MCSPCLVVCGHKACISPGWISTDTGYAGCRWVKITVKCAKYTAVQNTLHVFVMGIVLYCRFLPQVRIRWYYSVLGMARRDEGELTLVFHRSAFTRTFPSCGIPPATTWYVAGVKFPSTVMQTKKWWLYTFKAFQCPLGLDSFSLSVVRQRRTLYKYRHIGYSGLRAVPRQANTSALKGASRTFSSPCPRL